MKKLLVVGALFVLLVFFEMQLARAQVREFDSVIISGAELQEQFGQVAISNLVAYNYQLSSKKWQSVPLQVDERDENWKYIFSASEGLLSDKDEVVFMAKDAGDRVGPEFWIADQSSRKYPRAEIKIRDTFLNQEKYVYIFQTDNPEDQVVATDYVSYLPEIDRVVNNNYELGHNYVSNGLIENLVIPETAGGTGEDFLDRFKLRLRGQADLGWGKIDILINEEEQIRKDKIFFKDGVVRVLRNWRVKIVYQYASVASFTFGPYDLIFKFYSHGVTFNIEGLILPNNVSLNLIRWSFDLDPTALGMRAWTAYCESVYPQGAVIDRKFDKDFSRYLAVPDWNWMMQTGTPGTLLTVAYVVDIGSNQYLYYHDRISDTNDGTPDTGYDGSWGDMGIKYVNNISSGVDIPLKARLYFLGPNISPDSAEVITNFVRHPVITEIESQVVPVELASFTATVQTENQILLQWITKSEIHNFGFEVERKIGEDSDWTKIGFVEGRGTTAQSQVYQFVNKTITADKYYYRLKQIDTDGTYKYYGPVSVEVLAKQFALQQNYPNPFNNQTVISYSIAEPSQVKLKIFNFQGQLVEILVSDYKLAGNYSIGWKAGNCATGIYYCVLEADNFKETKQMMFVK